MTDKRYQELMGEGGEGDAAETPMLSEAEQDEGWHFCNEFDGLLVQGDPKEKYCGKACIEWCRGK
jgi:hypothetical protein